MYVRHFRDAESTRRFLISDATENGWVVQEERDDAVVRSVVYTDWHRVERARLLFVAESARLRQAGWVEC
jgi:membrane carboxypeptidase/penicillin-binding protein